MQRITNLLQKLTDLSSKNGEPEIIDVDLMLDYTKVIYADLLEMRGRIAFNSSLVQEVRPVSQQTPVKQEIKESYVDNSTDADPVKPKIQEPEAGQQPTLSQTEPVAQPVVAIDMHTDADIRKIIGINDKYQFISELFNKNGNAYEEVLTKMNTFNSYPEAIGWLDEVHSENNWNDDNDTVVSFYNIVNHYFASK